MSSCGAFALILRRACRLKSTHATVFIKEPRSCAPPGIEELDNGFVCFRGTWNTGRTTKTPHYQHQRRSFLSRLQKHSQSDDFYVAGVGTRSTTWAESSVVCSDWAHCLASTKPTIICRKAWAAGDTSSTSSASVEGGDNARLLPSIQELRAFDDQAAIRSSSRSPPIRFLGLWDIVAAFGLANLGKTELNIGHHLALPRSILTYCFHALALDERRTSFLPTRLRGQ